MITILDHLTAFIEVAADILGCTSFRAGFAGVRGRHAPALQPNSRRNPVALPPEPPFTSPTATDIAIDQKKNVFMHAVTALRTRHCKWVSTWAQQRIIRSHASRSVLRLWPVSLEIVFCTETVSLSKTKTSCGLGVQNSLARTSVWLSSFSHAEYGS